METTVGELIGMLEKFDKDEPIITTCRACRKGTIGERIKVEDRTNQMYGYVNLVINQPWETWEDKK